MKITSVDQFKKNLIKFCNEQGYEIAGTCSSEGIYGEITINKIGEDNGWSKWEESKFNFVDVS